MWDLCALSMRQEDNSWDTRNAEDLFDHIVQSGQRVYGFQLGNEPGHWYTRHEGAPSGSQIGADFLTLRRLIDEKFSGLPNVPLIMGPDVCGPGELNDDHPCADYEFFLEIVKGGEAALDAVTIHHYGELSRRA